MSRPYSKALATVRQKIVTAIQGTRKKYPKLRLGHKWGVQIPYGAQPWRPDEDVGTVCPMACVILHYDKVNDVLIRMDAAAKILGTRDVAISGFIRGFDSLTDKPYRADIQMIIPPRRRLYQEWWHLGASFRGYARRKKVDTC